MDFYVIPPLRHLDMMNEGDRFFCLAQLYMKDESYRQFFKMKVAQGRWVTLDNGAGDHDLVTEDQLIAVAKDLMPSEVIPPDVLFNGVATIRNLETFVNRMKEEGLLDKIQIFACPQGKDREEWMFVYKYMLYHPNVTTLGFSKIAVPYAFLLKKNDEMIKEARHLAYDTLKAAGLIQKPIHCLGAGDPREFEYYKGDPLMRSTDSCFSVWSGMNKISWADKNYIRIATPKDYFERSLTEEQEAIAYKNIFWLKESLGQ
jgi:hypothetical protein